MENYKKQMEAYCASVENYLSGCFSDESLPQKTLFRSMRYSLLAGGKRIRPILALEFSRLCGGDVQTVLPFACALEMVHTYSLIHDDLPCMDNDDYRRGRLTNHKVFGDDIAVLAGDALLTAAFDTMSSADASAEVCLSCIRILSRAAGEMGMVGGQVLDMEGERRVLSPEDVYETHRMKTGCLISAACRVGVAAASGTQAQLEAAGKYAAALGLAFQIRDDMLDVLGDAETLGKATHMDNKKTTFVDFYGVEGCAKLIADETEKAIRALDIFDDPDFLVDLARHMAIRDY